MRKFKPGDIRDSLGCFRQFLPQPVRPVLNPVNITGRANRPKDCQFKPMPEAQGDGGLTEFVAVAEDFENAMRVPESGLYPAVKTVKRVVLLAQGGDARNDRSANPVPATKTIQSALKIYGQQNIHHPGR
jgi:hypothetical protein